jgi:hypothetical protein
MSKCNVGLEDKKIMLLRVAQSHNNKKNLRNLRGRAYLEHMQ